MFVPTGNFVETFGRLCDCGGTLLSSDLIGLCCDLSIDLSSDLRDGVVVDLCDDQLVDVGGGGLLVVAGRGRDAV